IVALLIVGAGVAAGVAAAGSWNHFLDAALLGTDAKATPGLLLLSFLALINFGLLVFNLIPAFPLDGGRVARAIAWQVTGDRVRATRLAAALGQGFSYVLMGLGIFQLVSG